MKYWLVFAIFAYEGSINAQNLDETKRPVQVDVEKLSPKETQKMIIHRNGKLNTEFSDDQFDAYELDNGQIILKHKFLRSSVLYKTIDEYRLLRNQIIGLSTIQQPILSAYQAEIVNLKKDPSIFIEQLSKRFSYKIDPSNPTDEYLEQLNGHIYKYLETNDREEVYFDLVVFIGEHIKYKVNGEWLFKQNDLSTEVTEIFIIDQEGKIFNPWLGLYKKMNEGDEIYLRSLILGIIERQSLR